MSTDPIMPSDVSDHLGVFDRFAEAASRLASRAWFFCFCVLLVIVWAPSIVFIRNIDTWQLIINTLTTIVTFLMVALLQNSQTRSDQALQHKLNAIADALSDLMDDQGNQKDATELRDAVGLEKRESTSDNSAHAGDGASTGETRASRRT
jgi:low affinity Fe/Cu permease